ncbi:visual pigment-like receptor peropsin [Galendromus occidentalis]|uniref:Visual pigment-like receptor peropsin n=1 Tax=Galendromus occidentalis TaxID=34638 RepID=A0AAJ6QUS7_9ACAR|nr:visual pigment-like receptor peropsin [Galendromus occidentalis]
MASSWSFDWEQSNWWKYRTNDTHLTGVFANRFVSQTTQTLLGIYLSITGTCGLIANFLVLAMFIRTKGRLSPSSMVLLNLTVTDIFILFCGFPTHTLANFAGRWIYGDLGCALYGFFGFFFGTAHIGSLSILSYEQYRMISEMKPDSCPTQKYLDRLHHRYRTYVILIWCFSLFWASLPLVGWSRYYYEPYGTACTIDWQTNDFRYRTYIIAYFIGGYVFPFGLMIYSYTRIVLMKRAYRILHGRQLSIKADIIGTLKENREEDLTLLAVLTVITFVVTWTPYAVLCVYCVFADPASVPTSMILAPSICAKTSGCVNPFIYTFTSKNMRDGMMESLNKMRIPQLLPASNLKEINATFLADDQPAENGLRGDSQE